MRLLDILSEGKKSNVDWVKRLIEIGNEYTQGHAPEPLEKEAMEIMTWAYGFCKEYISLMPDWLERAFKVYIQEAAENQTAERAEYEEITLF